MLCFSCFFCIIWVPHCNFLYANKLIQICHCI